MKGGENTKRLVKILLVFGVLIISMFSSNYAFVSAAGQVDLVLGKPLDVSIGGTTNLVTDGDTDTYYRLAAGSVLSYTFSSPQSIYGYSLKVSATDVTSQFRLIFYDENDAQITFKWASIGNGTKVANDTSLVLHNVKRVELKAHVNNYAMNAFDLKLYGEPDTTPPPAVTGLRGTVGDSKVTLNWNTVAASDLSGYRIYLNGALYTTVTTPTGVVTGLTNGTEYEFSVSSFDDSANESPKVSIKLTPTGPAPPDTTPPAVPLGLTAKAANQQAVLSWTANKEPDLAGYVLYQDGTKLRQVNGSTYTVSGLTNGQTYTFAVSAIDTSGNESARSAAVTVIPTDRISVVAIPNMDSIILQISGGSGPYEVNWGSGQSATVSDTQFTIPGLTANTSYVITVVDSGGLTWSGTVNTGDHKAYVPPSMPNPQEMFQRMLDVFGVAGTIALAIIGGAILLGLMCLLAMWGWRLLKRWLARAK